MAHQEFTWYPDSGSSMSIEPLVEQTKFGDGYELRIPKGINYMPESWDLRFTGVEVESGAILAFLKAHGGAQAFEWVNPNGDLGVYVCREWKAVRLKGGAMEISCKFEQVFEA